MRVCVLGGAHAHDARARSESQRHHSEADMPTRCTLSWKHWEDQVPEDACRHTYVHEYLHMLFDMRKNGSTRTPACEWGRKAGQPSVFLMVVCTSAVVAGTELKTHG